MKIALIGYGKMGKLIEEIALKEKLSVVSKIDPKLKTSEINEKNLCGADVCIDFSAPHIVLENIKKLAKLNQTIVVGTTGWYDQLDTVKELVLLHNIGLLYAPNFSIGVNLYLKMVAHAALLANKFEEYDVAGFEVHHREKKDSPSGTAKSIAETLTKYIDRKKSITYEMKDGLIASSELHFASLRAGFNPGQHNVTFESAADTISLTHQARNREGFAKGAIIAAKWLLNKKGLYTIDDLMEDYI